MYDKKYVLLYITMLLFGIDGLRTRIQAYKAAKLYLASAKVFEETEQNRMAQIEYLCRLLDEHKVPYNEFDIIALHYYAD
jgi:hypothetical protein